MESEFNAAITLTLATAVGVFVWYMLPTVKK